MPQEGAVSRPVAGEVSSLRLIQDAFSTLVIAPGWRAEFWPGVGHLLKHELETQTGTEERGDLNATPRVLRRELLRHRLHAVVEEMGALLCRTALSTNIRERLDFSCALLDADGQLISSAPHIPVHLGALGECVRSVMARLPMEVGDTVVTNHPAYGGSHLPDITLITPVHDAAGQRIGFVANRAHHAEIGGMAPGSMPTAARCLEEEGVVIEPMKLIAAGESCFAAMEAHFRGATHPSRQVADNLADLHAQLAANQLGLRRL
ncbi:MAG: hydantoinase B/oxoprolinase family protein, partial [Verrucomicrobiae bacterium]|nr:hydantoinase B/oxoprolinase family protein [Verrucomicrobiae bacterium]